MLHELDLAHEPALTTHPEVVFRRYSVKGRMFFEDYLRAMSELDAAMAREEGEPPVQEGAPLQRVVRTINSCLYPS